MDWKYLEKQFEASGIIPEDEIDSAREHCMCGDHVDHHTIGSGHAPVSMYDHYFYVWQVENGHTSDLAWTQDRKE